ncbi:MAG: hypothetical protein ACO1N9_13785 [Flavobacterium sp.]
MNKFTIAFFLLTAVSYGQTKIISHKSHSGSIANFALAAENDLFDINASNFGDIPYRNVTTSVLDSVIFLSDDKAIMVTSEYCHKDWRREPLKNSTEEKTLWKAGHDTVYNHPLFARRHSLDSIKAVLKKDYHFKNDTDKAVFVGYDNKVNKYKRENKRKKKAAIPVTLLGNMLPPKPLMISVLLIVSGFIMIITYKASRRPAIS